MILKRTVAFKALVELEDVTTTTQTLPEESVHVHESFISS